MNKLKGVFITIEGGEGSGKSTAIQGINKWLEEERVETLVTREPGGVRVSEQIRNILVNEEMHPLTEAMLFASSRNEITNKVLIPALKEGKVILCDRFIDSSYVYQGLVRGLGLEVVEQVNKPILDVIQPDITLYFDIAPEVGLGRIQKNGRETNKFDKESLDFHYKVRESYQMLAKMDKHKNRIYTINANQTPDNVVKDCINLIQTVLKKKPL